MTKQEAINKVEENGAKVLYARTKNGVHQITVGWKDYMKVRDLDTEEIAIKVR